MYALNNNKEQRSDKMGRESEVIKAVDRLTSGIAYEDYKEQVKQLALFADELCAIHKVVYGSEYGDMIAMVSEDYACFYSQSFTARTRNAENTRIEGKHECVRVLNMKADGIDLLPIEYGKDLHNLVFKEILLTVLESKSLISLSTENSVNASDVNNFVSSLTWTDDHDTHRFIDDNGLTKALRLLNKSQSINLSRSYEDDVITLTTKHFLITFPMYIIDEAETTARKTILIREGRQFKIGRKVATSMFYKMLDNQINGENDGNKKTPNIQLCN